MTVTRTAQRALILLSGALLAVIYAVAWAAPSMGLFRDDAVNLIAARSLVTGHGYTYLNLPPLFPVLLSLFLLVSDQTQWLKLLPLLCATGWLFATCQLLRRMGAGHFGALLLVGLTAASPPVVFFSTHLLSEPLFALLVAGALLALLDDRMFVAGILAGLATLTSAAGLPVIAACALTILVRGRFRRAAIFTATAMLIAAPWFGWSLAHGAADAYYIFTSLPASEKAAVLGTNMLFLFMSPFALISGVSDTYAAIFTLLLTLYCLWKRRHTMPDLLVLLYCAMLVCRPGPPQRFLAPLLPLILWLYWRVAQRIRSVEALAAIVVLIALIPFSTSLRRLPETLRAGEFPPTSGQPDDWNQMKTLFAWIRANTAPDAILAANLDPAFYLHTGRKTVRGFVSNGYRTFYQPGGQAVTPDELSATLVRDGVNYVSLTPDRDFQESGAWHKAVEALERGGFLEPVPIPGLSRGYRLLRTAATK